MRSVKRVAAIALLALLLVSRDARAEENPWVMSEKIEGGYELGAMYGRAMQGGRLRLGLGGQNDDRALWGTLSMRYGATFTGLRTWDVRFGGDSELVRRGIFHVGGGADFGVHGYTLAAKRDVVNHAERDLGWALSFGLSVRAGIDVVRLGESKRSAITLDGRLDGHLFLIGYYASAGVFLGARF